MVHLLKEECKYYTNCVSASIRDFMEMIKTWVFVFCDITQAYLLVLLKKRIKSLFWETISIVDKHLQQRDIVYRMYCTIFIVIKNTSSHLVHPVNKTFMAQMNLFMGFVDHKTQIVSRCTN